LTTSLTPRARSVLYAAVSEFIRTGEPVGSRTLTKKYRFDLSPATIRNVLADLEDLGYLVQPHTSAGRVPTQAAFRLFIDALMKTQQLSPEATAKIATWLDEAAPGQDMLRSTGKLLSELTGVPAIVARVPGKDRNVLRIRFIPTRPQEVLSVVVFSDGSVENRFIRIEHPISSRELERLHDLLERVVEGRSLGEIREHFARARDDNREEIARLQIAEQRLVDGVLAAPGQVSEVVVEGQSRLLSRPELASGAQLKDLLDTLEDHERLVTILDRTMTANHVQVFLGGELGEATGVGTFSLIAAPFRSKGGEPAGALGVLGPARMDYPVVVPLVSATAEAVGAALSKSEPSDASRHGGSRPPDD
jgi:heat-inducible transcriptional repressor